jgi:hypothetical protein
MERTIGRSAAGRCGRAVRRGRAARLLCLFMVLGVCLTSATTAVASPSSFTWAGVSTTSDGWSFPANWAGDAAPTAEIGTLTFPRLTSTACTTEPTQHPCYVSFNNVSGLSAESVQIDDGDGYLIGGDEIALGAGGLNASPASGASGPAGDFVEVPFNLTASQTWSIANRGGGEIGENGMLLRGDLTGSGSALNTELSNGAAWIIENSTEVGPLKIYGPKNTGPRISNGLVILEDGELNSADERPVDLSHILFAGSGAVGALTTEDAAFDVGSGFDPVEGIEASSVKLDASSDVDFEVAGTTAQQDYSQLLSHGAIELNDASIEVFVRPLKEGESCPVLAPGQTFTFASTISTLSGSFANAPEGGAELPISFAKSCVRKSQTIQINYVRSGGTETVTGTVEAAVFKRHQEEEAAKHEEEAKREEATRKLAEEHAKKVAEEAAAAETVAKNKHEEEVAAAVAKQRQYEEIAAANRRAEEEAARGAVLGVREGTPDATLASAALQASASGVVNVKISCPAAASNCAGTVTLRTLGAVKASVAGAVEAKPAILTLATGSFTIQGGQTKTVTLHLSVKARSLLGRVHMLRIRATVAAHDAAGASHVVQLTATLHAAKKHG